MCARSATGDRRTRDAEVLLRITVAGTFPNLVGGPTEVTETRCHLLVQSGRYDLFTPVPHRCPDP
jgi:hypothetical protein